MFCIVLCFEEVWHFLYVPSFLDTKMVRIINTLDEKMGAI